MVNKEGAESKRFGARLHKNSGRGKYEKADASNDIFVIDFKHYKKSFSISKDVWGKICTDTWKTDPKKAPMLYLVLGEGKSPTRLAVIEVSVLEELVEAEAKWRRYEESVRVSYESAVKQGEAEIRRMDDM